MGPGYSSRKNYTIHQEICKLYEKRHLRKSAILRAVPLLFGFWSVGIFCIYGSLNSSINLFAGIVLAQLVVVTFVIIHESKV